jgi:hypothetical protein
MSTLLDENGRFDRRAIHAKALHHYRRGFSPTFAHALAFIWREARGRRGSTRVQMDMIAAAIGADMAAPGGCK